MGFGMVMSTMLGMNSAFAGGYVGVGYDNYFEAGYLYGGINVHGSKGNAGSIEAGVVSKESVVMADSTPMNVKMTGMKFIYL